MQLYRPLSQRSKEYITKGPEVVLNILLNIFYFKYIDKGNLRILLMGAANEPCKRLQHYCFLFVLLLKAKVVHQLS